jgi:ABC-type polysaccharide/polyol phosphate transport system ATPase subunit
METAHALEVRNISKVYRLYAKPADRLREIMTRRPHHRRFVALEDVSFALPQGETMGIIGDNGAGKSTLLKILAGTLTPTTGEVLKRGRVAALLELGAGFHPEFTGRQNIYLNASLMGLKEDEIRAKEQDIIDFSELKDSIDRPVKTYSSGMHVRLAFSIATTVNPDILIIDEALSVGDQHFQKKCMERMTGFRDSGKTILFCSHSMYLVEELCKTSVWLQQGRMERYGATSEVVGAYLAYLENNYQAPGKREEQPAAADAPHPEVVIESVRVVDSRGEVLEHIRESQDVIIEVRTRRVGPPLKGHLGIGLVRPDGQLLFGTTTKQAGLDPVVFNGQQTTKLVLPDIPVLHGMYRVKTIAGDETALRSFYEHVTDEVTFSCARPEMGVFRVAYDWRLPPAEPRESRTRP